MMKYNRSPDKGRWELPVHELTGTTLQLLLQALESALIEDSRVIKVMNDSRKIMRTGYLKNLCL